MTLKSLAMIGVSSLILFCQHTPSSAASVNDNYAGGRVLATRFMPDFTFYLYTSDFSGSLYSYYVDFKIATSDYQGLVQRAYDDPVSHSRVLIGIVAKNNDPKILYFRLDMKPDGSGGLSAVGLEISSQAGIVKSRPWPASVLNGYYHTW